MTKSFALSGDRALDVSIYGNNLLDEVVRNHTSSVKDHVPLPGRNIGLRVQMDF
jgi:outer membrane receptor protein involved in Fe transport